MKPTSGWRQTSCQLGGDCPPQASCESTETRLTCRARSASASTYKCWVRSNSLRCIPHCKSIYWQQSSFCHLYSPNVSQTPSTSGSPRWDAKLITRKHCVPKAAYSGAIPGQSSRNALPDRLIQTICKNCKQKKMLLCAVGFRPVSFVA